MKTISCKIPDSMETMLEAATAERDVFRSELVRAALRHYVASNPDGYAAFDKEDYRSGVGERRSGRRTPSKDEQLSILDDLYDPLGSDQS